MKRFLTLSTSLLIVLVACSATTASAKGETGNANAKSTDTVVFADLAKSLATGLLDENRTLGVMEQYQLDAQLRAEKAEELRLAEEKRQRSLARNADNLKQMVQTTKKYVGVTWYAFSGSTPSGWDCSGLVRWAYARVGVDLYHSASVQKNAGRIVKSPSVGDIVSFGWRGYRGAQHVGIYVGEGKMIHSGGRQGHRTEITSIKDWADGSGNTLITYTRILDN